MASRQGFIDRCKGNALVRFWDLATPPAAFILSGAPPSLFWTTWRGAESKDPEDVSAAMQFQGVLLTLFGKNALKPH